SERRRGVHGEVRAGRVQDRTRSYKEGSRELIRPLLSNRTESVSVTELACYLDHVQAAMWSASGILAAGLLGTIFSFNARLDAGFAHIEARMDAGFARVDERFARVDERFDRVDQRLSQIDLRLDQVNSRIDALSARL